MMSDHHLRELEELRCRAISELDLETLADLLDEGLTHTHLNGTTEDRTTYLGSITARPRRTTPGPVSIVSFGDTAVMTGTLRNEGHRADGTPVTSEIAALRVWHRTTGGWRLAAFAASGPVGER